MLSTLFICSPLAYELAGETKGFTGVIVLAPVIQGVVSAFPIAKDVHYEPVP